MAEEYCWAIAQALGHSCCRRSSSVILEFRFQLEFHLYTRTFDHVYRVIHKSLRNFRTRLRNNQDRHRRVDISSTCKVGQKLEVSLPLLTCSPSAWPSRLLYRRGRRLGLSSVRVAGFSLQHGHYPNPAAPNLQHTTNREQMTDLVIQQHSRKLLMMDIFMSETCWANKKWNKTASDIKSIFYSSAITMMHGPINVIFRQWLWTTVPPLAIFHQ